jgi:oligopeptide/dipeptide ABC transporter ATP-binding protein
MTATQVPSTTATTLDIVDLVKHFGPVRAVDGVSLTVARGEVLGLVGESGSGKSTLGRCVTRLVPVTSGQVRVNGTDISRLSRRKVRPLRKQFNIVFQDPASSLNPRMTVADIVGEPLRLHGLGTHETRADRVNELLDQVGIAADVGRRYPHELSGGQRQRVSLARALSAGPSLLVADEPTSALDVSVQAAVLNLIGRLQRDLGFACLFITHDLASVEFLAQRIAVMYLGVLVEVASREELFAAPRHPYTQALLSAAPIPDPLVQRTRRRIVLSGEVPSPVDPPSGCRFHPRCPVAVPECSRVVPPLRPVGPRGDLVACHLVNDDGSGPRLV